MEFLLRKLLAGTNIIAKFRAMMNRKAERQGFSVIHAHQLLRPGAADSRLPDRGTAISLSGVSAKLFHRYRHRASDVRKRLCRTQPANRPWIVNLRHLKPLEIKRLVE